MQLIIRDLIYRSPHKHITGFKATALSSETNPTAAVPSTLTIKCKDMYGHDVIIKVAMTVNKR